MADKKKVIGFNTWDNGHETSAVNPQALTERVRNLQQALADELGRPISWQVAKQKFLVDCSNSFQQIINNASEALSNQKHDPVEPSD